MTKTLKSMDVPSILFGASLVILGLTLYFGSASITKSNLERSTEIDHLQMEIDILTERVKYLEQKQTASNKQMFERLLKVIIMNSNNKEISPDK